MSFTVHANMCANRQLFYAVWNLYCALHVLELRFNACGLGEVHVRLNLSAKLVAANKRKKIHNCF